MKKVTITKATGTGVLTKAADGKWNIEINSKPVPGNIHYTDDQVDRIIASAKAAGNKVEIE